VIARRLHMPKPSSVSNVGVLSGTESIPLDNGTAVALKTTPADLKTYMNLLTLGITTGTAADGKVVNDHIALTTTAHGGLLQLGTTSTTALRGDTSIPSITGLLDETAHDLLDHTGLTGVGVGAGSKLRCAIPIATFDLIGATSEPILTYTDATNDYSYLEFDGADATGHKAYFTIPSGITAAYTGGDINIAIDYYLSGTLTDAETVIMACGMIEVNSAVKGGDQIGAVTLPSSSAGYDDDTYIITASGENGAAYLRQAMLTITADDSLSAGSVWQGYILRKSATDTSAADTRVVGVTVYE